MRHLYSLLLYLALPLVLLRLLWRSRRAPDYRRRWPERLGWVPRLATDRPVLWIHAVSVGEAQAAEPLIRQLGLDYPGHQLLVTTGTPTGSARVRALFGEQVAHCYAPFDLPGAVARFLDRCHPDLLLMVETEIWPNLLWQCRQRGVRTLLANARLSQRSAEGYARFGRFAADTLACIDHLAVQTEDDASRFRQLGVDPDRVSVTGSIKFDQRLSATLQDQVEVLRRDLGGRPVWIAASTHEGEDEQLLQAHRRLLALLPLALLVLVPRHPERFDRVSQLLQREGFAQARRSLGEQPATLVEVYLADTMGELPALIGVSDVAFIGGSLVPVGGHNVLEAAAQGVPVLFGPHMFNFAQISRMLLDAGAAEQVEDADQLASKLATWLADASQRGEVGEQGRALVERNRGALERLLGAIDLLMKTGR